MAAGGSGSPVGSWMLDLLNGDDLRVMDDGALDDSTLSAVCNALPFIVGGAGHKREAPAPAGADDDDDGDDSDDECGAGGGAPAGKKSKAASAARSKNKASKEKERRSKINERFNELAKLIEPDSTETKVDKPSILQDAIKFVRQMTAENHQLKMLNKFLEERVSHFEREKGQALYQHSLAMNGGGLAAQQPGVQQQGDVGTFMPLHGGGLHAPRTGMPAMMMAAMGVRGDASGASTSYGGMQQQPVGMPQQPMGMHQQQPLGGMASGGGQGARSGAMPQARMSPSPGPMSHAEHQGAEGQPQMQGQQQMGWGMLPQVQGPMAMMQHIQGQARVHGQAGMQQAGMQQPQPQVPYGMQEGMGGARRGSAGSDMKQELAQELLMQAVAPQQAQQQQAPQQQQQQYQHQQQPRSMVAAGQVYAGLKPQSLAPPAAGMLQHGAAGAMAASAQQQQQQHWVSPTMLDAAQDSLLRPPAA
ncbi:hypothetical protein FOA52_011639 [Chlamydomonas sp. UWO 241]|nr:hypothetical protein FOA52_011639 [Chlamydomonas sp. UWO 241]